VVQTVKDSDVEIGIQTHKIFSQAWVKKLIWDKEELQHNDESELHF